MISYEPIDPGAFKEGDIVEATGTFIAYPTALHATYKPVFCLRSLTMLNSSFREVRRTRLHQAPTHTSTVRNPARSVRGVQPLR